MLNQAVAVWNLLFYAIKSHLELFQALVGGISITYLDVSTACEKEKFKRLSFEFWNLLREILPGVYVMLSFDPTFGLARSLKSCLTSNILLSPPPLDRNRIIDDWKFHVAREAHLACDWHFLMSQFLISLTIVASDWRSRISRFSLMI